MTFTARRSDLEVLLFMLVRARELLGLLGELVDQACGYVEHIRHGGAPSEWRRDRWLTVESVKNRYRGKGKG